MAATSSCPAGRNTRGAQNNGDDLWDGHVAAPLTNGCANEWRQFFKISNYVKEKCSEEWRCPLAVVPGSAVWSVTETLKRLCGKVSCFFSPLVLFARQRVDNDLLASTRTASPLMSHSSQKSSSAEEKKMGKPTAGYRRLRNLCATDCNMHHNYRLD